ncbi:MAG TPA: hypothetical protein VFB12_28080 [Ktedonobacteraceae bacterium]|nr:hypothetical protein [Ktedonobacteraceae bacterium]
MSEIVEPIGGVSLNPGGIGDVRVSHKDGLVWIKGYGQEIGLSYKEALRLSGWLHHYAGFLQDRVKNYYECHECGRMHRKSVKVCPALFQDGDSDWEYEADDNSYGTAKWT